MSEIVKIESIVISLVSVCPECGYHNITTEDHFPDAETVVNEEVQLYYDVACKNCKHNYKIGANVTAE